MEKQGSRIEVLGVPHALSADRIKDKLFIHFLRPRNGGGEVLWVVYPTSSPGQAFVIFEEPEVAARVLQQSAHMLKVDKHQFPLRVNAVDTPEMDLPVEATLDLRNFPDKTEVQQLLHSHGFKMTELTRDQVRVNGSFKQLRAVKVRLEEPLHSQTRAQVTQNSTSPVPRGRQLSSGAIPKNYTSDRLWQNGNSSPHASRNKPSHEFPSSAISSSSMAFTNSHGQPGSAEYGASQSQRQDHHPSTAVSFITSTDVLDYAQRLRNKDISEILQRNNTKLEVSQVGSDLSNVSLSGKNAKIAIRELQKFLSKLGKSLRTQEINLKDLDHDTKVDVAKRIQKYKSIYDSVFISQLDDIVHLIGPSADSYELKQRLLGKPVDQPLAMLRGRTWDRGSKGRSSSLSRLNDKRKAERAHGAVHEPLPAGAHGYSPSRYQDEKEEGAEAEPTAGARQNRLFRRRSQSTYLGREKDKAEKEAAHRHEKENKQPNPGSSKILQSLKQNLSINEIKQRFRRNKNK